MCADTIHDYMPVRQPPMHTPHESDALAGGPAQGSAKDDGFNFAANYLSEVTTIDVTTGDNQHYPNPPAWGLSYHLNLLETPVM